MKHLLTSIMCFTGMALLVGGISSAKAEFPAVFKSGRFQISTLEQFGKRVSDLHPTLEVTLRPVDAVEYKSQTYDAMVMLAEGVKNGSRIEQKITYIRVVPGLWKLVFVESKHCIRGKALNTKKEWVEKWMCDDDSFPIHGFSDLYIVEDEQVSMEVLSQFFKEPVLKLNQVEPEKSESVVTLRSLADLELQLKELGSEVQFESSVYKNSLKPNSKEKPAIKIWVKGSLPGQRRLHQSFLYEVVGSKLKLKEIEGQICYFVERMGKDICEGVYVPTPASPMPMELLNSHQLTGFKPIAQKPVEEYQSQNSCGYLPSHFQTVLKIHFERSLFDVSSTEELERVIRNLPYAADPMGVLLDKNSQNSLLSKWKSEVGQTENLAFTATQMRRGESGDCQFLYKKVEDLNAEMRTRLASAFQVLKEVKEAHFDLSQLDLSGWSDQQQFTYQRFLTLLRDEAQDAQKLDLFLGQMTTYLKDTMARLNSPEEILISAMAKQDAYSKYIANTEAVSGTINGSEQRKYFGVAIQKGLSGKHYLAKLHPAVAESTALELNQVILQVNGLAAHEMSTEQLDTILRDRSKEIQLVVQGVGEPMEVRLEAREINPLDIVYDVELIDYQGETWASIHLKSFEAGVTAAIKKDLESLAASYELQGIRLDLKGNPGGNSDEAFNLISLFVKDRLISYSRVGSRHLAPVKTHQARPEFFFNDQLPLLVEVDARTMSAAEITASSLKSLGRSLTIGQRTYGKFVGQVYIPVTLKSKKTGGLLLTAMEFYDSDGRALNGIGLQPDITISSKELAQMAFAGELGQSRNLDPKDLVAVEKYASLEP